jgi:hypothetical protein
MLYEMVGRAKTAALTACMQVQSEFILRGGGTSSRMPLVMEEKIRPVHESLLANAMQLVVQFSQNTNISIPELIETTRPGLEAFADAVSVRISKTAHQMPMGQMRERFQLQLENALKDVKIGFIQGRRALMTEGSTSEGKAMRLLQALYDATRGQTEPVLVTTLNTGMSVPEAHAAWRYLKDRHLIDTFSNLYTARINARGIDAIEGAKRLPDHPSAAFPSVSYNIVTNTMHVGTMHDSPVQQGGVSSAQTLTVTYSSQDLTDVHRLVIELRSHLDELSIDTKERQKAQAQLATLEAQLSTDPDPIIVRQAGRSLRNITEGAIGSLLAAAAQPTVWIWVQEAMHRLFG